MAEGQELGTRGYYIYTSDSSGKQYVILTDRTLGDLPGTGLIPANDTNAANLDSPPRRRFKPRGVYWQGTINGRRVRKFIICGTNEATLYAASFSVGVTIDTNNGVTTGRRGERVSFANLPAQGGGGTGGGGSDPALQPAV